MSACPNCNALLHQIGSNATSVTHHCPRCKRGVSEPRRDQITRGLKPDYAYHWSPLSRRKGIVRVGLKPGSLSRHRQWRPPFIAYSRDPEYALRSADIYDPIAEPMDLWQIDLDDRAHEDMSLLHDEIRVYERVPFRELLWIATRRPDDNPLRREDDE